MKNVTLESTPQLEIEVQAEGFRPEEILIEPQGVAQKTQRYWAGVLPECPFDSVTVGGFSIPQVSGLKGATLEEGTAERANHRDLLGCVLIVNDDQLQAIREGIANRVVRPWGSVEPPVVAALDEAVELEPHQRPRSRRATYAMIIRGGPKCKPGYKYTHQKNDVPLARYVWLAKVPDNLQHKTARETLLLMNALLTLPPVMSEAGKDDGADDA